MSCNGPSHVTDQVHSTNCFTVVSPFREWVTLNSLLLRFWIRYSQVSKVTIELLRMCVPEVAQ